MTAKEKAIELVETMSLATDELGYINKNVHRHKQCALKAANEVIGHIEKSYYNQDVIKGAKLYWIEVKQEIEKL